MVLVMESIHHIVVLWLLLELINKGLRHIWRRRLYNRGSADDWNGDSNGLFGSQGWWNVLLVSLIVIGEAVSAPIWRSGLLSLGGRFVVWPFDVMLLPLFFGGPLLSRLLELLTHLDSIISEVTSLCISWRSPIFLVRSSMRRLKIPFGAAISRRVHCLWLSLWWLIFHRHEVLGRLGLIRLLALSEIKVRCLLLRLGVTWGRLRCAWHSLDVWLLHTGISYWRNYRLRRTYLVLCKFHFVQFLLFQLNFGPLIYHFMFFILNSL